MNRAARREWRRRASGLLAPEEYPSETVAAPKRPAPAPISHSEAREAFTRALMDEGMSREKAEAAALGASVRACRREGFKL